MDEVGALWGCSAGVPSSLFLISALYGPIRFGRVWFALWNQEVEVISSCGMPQATAQRTMLQRRPRNPQSRQSRLMMRIRQKGRCSAMRLVQVILLSKSWVIVSNVIYAPVYVRTPRLLIARKLAQLIREHPVKQQVPGSNPSLHSWLCGFGLTPQAVVGWISSEVRQLYLRWHFCILEGALRLALWVGPYHHSQDKMRREFDKCF